MERIIQKSAVIFDFDGVIVNTEQFHADAWHKTFQDQGLPVSREDCLPAVELEDHLFAAQLLDRLAIKDDPRAWVRQKQLVFQTLLDQVQIYPGFIELAQALAPHFKLAIVSSAWVENIAKVIKRADLFDSFHVLIGKEDVVAHKPAPDGYLLAARRLGANPEHCTVFEDSPTGIRSAKAAGMRCIGVAHRGKPGQLKEADMIVPDLVDTACLLKLIQDFDAFKFNP